jgi:hypothetical protein
MIKLLLALLLLSLANIACAELKVITLQHRFANDIIPTLEPLLTADDAITGTNNQLIIRTSPQQMHEIEDLISQLDTERVNRRITVKSNQTDTNNNQGITANGKIKTSRIIIGNNPYNSTNSVNIDLDHNQNHVQHSSQQFINVLDGERAFIHTGSIVPYSQDWVTITRRYVQVITSTDWREISTGFAVRPRTIGNMVEVEITPRIARLNSNQFIDFEELSTVVNVNLGEWLDIGNTMQQRDEVSRKILGTNTLNTSQSSILMIKID